MFMCLTPLNVTSGGLNTLLILLSCNFIFLFFFCHCNHNYVFSSYSPNFSSVVPSGLDIILFISYWLFVEDLYYSNSFHSIVVHLVWTWTVVVLYLLFLFVSVTQEKTCLSIYFANALRLQCVTACYYLIEII